MLEHENILIGVKRVDISEMNIRNYFESLFMGLFICLFTVWYMRYQRDSLYRGTIKQAYCLDRIVFGYLKRTVPCTYPYYTGHYSIFQDKFMIPPDTAAACKHVSLLKP